MPMLTPTAATGATSMPCEMVYVDPRRAVTEQTLAEQVALDGVNVPFLAGTLSMMLTHERCGRQLYRSVAARTHNPVLKRRYEELGRETEEHADALEDLIRLMGGNPAYVSPAARATERTDGAVLESTFLLSGSVDVMTAEAVMLNAVLMAETVDHANWALLSQLVSHLPEGPVRDRMAEISARIEDEEDEHVAWARETHAKMALVQARSSTLAKVGMKAEEMMATVRSWFD